jgi:polysaccharide deacetylase family protein (PEP-CTERM system associated)
MKTHFFTVDLEDWPQSVLDRNLSISSRVVENTERLLDLLGQYGVKGTFFCLGLVAEKYPELIRSVHNSGHEIGTHGWSHQSVKQLGPEKFKSELLRSIKLLEDICGQRVRGHRAPDFSIDLDMHWAFDIMREAGLDYDSSVFPIPGKRYGSPNCPLNPFQDDNGLWELPLTAVNLLGKRRPVLGGGYFRLYPWFVSRACLNKLEEENRRAMFYMHPYEIAVEELNSISMPLKMRLHQGLFRSRIRLRLRKMLKEFKFGSIEELIPDGK